MSDKLLPCPCGETPTELHLDKGATYKWGWVSGNCCNEWHIEFRTVNYQPDSPETMEQAIKYWNDALRAQPSDKLPQDVELYAHTTGYSGGCITISLVNPEFAAPSGVALYRLRNDIRPKQSNERLAERLRAVADIHRGFTNATIRNSLLNEAIAALQEKNG